LLAGILIKWWFTAGVHTILVSRNNAIGVIGCGKWLDP